jgi:hypothetical protein
MRVYHSHAIMIPCDEVKDMGGMEAQATVFFNAWTDGPCWIDPIYAGVRLAR